MGPGAASNPVRDVEHADLIIVIGSNPTSNHPVAATWIKNAAARGTQIFEGCKALMAKYDVIGDVRGGHGLMTAIEMVSDRATKAPIDKATPAKVAGTAYAAGTMVRVSGPNLILSPPLILTEADAVGILAALDAGFAAI